MIAGLRKAFNSGVTKTYEWRKKQLEGVLTLLDENRDRIAQCLKDDLNKVLKGMHTIANNRVDVSFVTMFFIFK